MTANLTLHASQIARVCPNTSRNAVPMYHIKRSGFLGINPTAIPEARPTGYGYILTAKGRSQ
jgi:hypothetical protein